MVTLIACMAVLYIDVGSFLSIKRSVQCTGSGIEIVLRHHIFTRCPLFITCVCFWLIYEYVDWKDDS